MGMQVGGGGHGAGTELNSEINVTPMVDVMLVLLVIFMVAAPMMTVVDVDVPDAGGQSVEDPEGFLTLSIGKNSEISLGETKVRWGQLKDKLSANPRVQKEQKLYIQADKTLPYGVVVTAMAIARESNIKSVMMVTDPKSQFSILSLEKQAGASVDKAGVKKPGAK